MAYTASLFESSSKAYFVSFLFQPNLVQCTIRIIICFLCLSIIHCIFRIYSQLLWAKKSVSPLSFHHEIYGSYNTFCFNQFSLGSFSTNTCYTGILLNEQEGTYFTWLANLIFAKALKRVLDTVGNSLHVQILIFLVDH